MIAKTRYNDIVVDPRSLYAPGEADGEPQAEAGEADQVGARSLKEHDAGMKLACRWITGSLHLDRWIDGS